MARCADGDADAAKGPGDDEAIPGVELPAIFAFEMDGDDGGLGGLREFDDACLDAIDGAARAVGGDADVFAREE